MVNKYYEIVVFTASYQWYADKILDHIDPRGIYFQHRLYRESCIKTTDNVYVKDLRIFKNIDMKDMVLVDNAVYSFGAQLANGIPITPFKEDKNDIEFIFLMRFLSELRRSDDMRLPIRAAFISEEMKDRNLYNYDDFIDYYDLEECELEQERDDDYD